MAALPGPRGSEMTNRARCVALLCMLLLPTASAAEPVTLKLAFFTSDRASVYASAVKPFVDAVNAEGKDLLKIKVHFSGVLGREQDKQPHLVLNGTADIAFVTPGISLDLFHDNAVIELPGLFRDMREATLIYTRLIAANALKGYERFVTIGAYGSELESLHTRVPVNSLAELKGMTIRVNNQTAGIALKKLGMTPAVMPIHQISGAISNGSIGGTAVPLSMLFEFGIGRVATNHYFLLTSSAPLALLMNRQKFASLPPNLQGIIRKFSGDWAAARFIEARAKIETSVMLQLKADPRRNFVLPTPADVKLADTAFHATTEQFVSKSRHNRDLLRTVRSEVAKLRSGE
jgi:TRAP-type C4-dicarboxylate transport system substrate-binding protein